MTVDEAKKLVLWMQTHGVTQFAFDGLSVAFHPRSVKVKERSRGAEGTAPRADTAQGMTLEAMFPQAGVPYAESQ